VNHRKTPRQGVAIQDGVAGAEPGGQRPGSAGQIVRREVVGGRVDQVAGEENAIANAADRGRVDTVGLHQPGGGLLGLAISVKAVATQSKRERRKLLVAGVSGKLIITRWQGRREFADQQRIALGGTVRAQAKQNAGDVPVGTRQEHVAARLPFESLRQGETAFAITKAHQEAVDIVAGEKVDWRRLVQRLQHRVWPPSVWQDRNRLSGGLCNQTALTNP
jgi:hypothetical protein